MLCCLGTMISTERLRREGVLMRRCCYEDKGRREDTLMVTEGRYEPRREFKRGPSAPTQGGEEANNIHR